MVYHGQEFKTSKELVEYLVDQGSRVDDMGNLTRPVSSRMHMGGRKFFQKGIFSDQDLKYAKELAEKKDANQPKEKKVADKKSARQPSSRAPNQPQSSLKSTPSNKRPLSKKDTLSSVQKARMSSKPIILWQKDLSSGFNKDRADAKNYFNNNLDTINKAINDNTTAQENIMNLIRTTSNPIQKRKLRKLLNEVRGNLAKLKSFTS